MSLGLERMRDLLARLGNPQDRLRFVHVAGTNGKGSTCAFIERILREAGYRTGLFTSPYIERFEERIRVNGNNISLDDLCEVTLAVRDCAEAMDEHPTEFELMTAVAFCHFARQSCDIVVCEVGLGGRLDSTNVIAVVEASVIAPVALDHCALLGNTISAIAQEKAGIIKPGVPVVSAPQEPEAEARLRAVAAERGSSLRFVDVHALSGSNDDFTYGLWSHMRVALAGSYQRINAATALETVAVLQERGWRIPDDAVRVGLAQASWSGRFEFVAHAPDIIVDGAHNEQGAQALASELVVRYPRARIVFVVGVLADKDYASMLDALVPLAAQVVCTEPPNPRALGVADLAAAVEQACTRAGLQCTSAADAGAKAPPAFQAAVRRTASPSVEAGFSRIEGSTAAAPSDAMASTIEVVAEPDIDAAVARGCALVGADDVLVLCGSLYSVGAVKAALRAQGICG